MREPAIFPQLPYADAFLRIDLHHVDGLAHYIDPIFRNGIGGVVKDVQLSTLTDVNHIAPADGLNAGYV